MLVKRPELILDNVIEIVIRLILIIVVRLTTVTIPIIHYARFPLDAEYPLECLGQDSSSTSRFE
jgi:hypothetical protein